MDGKYGKCECGTGLNPIWFTEDETVITGGIMYKTGRKRNAISHLECPNCLISVCVDDSFDLPYR